MSPPSANRSDPDWPTFKIMLRVLAVDCSMVKGIVSAEPG
jgi:hypothetical protein